MYTRIQRQIGKQRVRLSSPNEFLVKIFHMFDYTKLMIKLPYLEKELKHHCFRINNCYFNCYMFSSLCTILINVILTNYMTSLLQNRGILLKCQDILFCIIYGNPVRNRVDGYFVIMHQSAMYKILFYFFKLNT